jgi:hypothetical protein
LGVENSLLLDIVKRRVITHELDLNENPETRPQVNQDDVLVDRYALKNVGNRNLILPMQSVQFLEAFTAAKKFDIDLFQALES